jgi:hypothetical protein
VYGGGPPLQGVVSDNYLIKPSLGLQDGAASELQSITLFLCSYFEANGLLMAPAHCRMSRLKKEEMATQGRGG